jgi:GrpB-like predicted nucleotidyltransferase (UPF0157 family)
VREVDVTIDIAAIPHQGMPGALVVRRHDPLWSSRFVRYRDSLRASLGPCAVRVDHVGSTAVEGLDARPVIDIQVSVVDVDAEEDYHGVLRGLGFRMVEREPDRRIFVRDEAPFDAQLYVCRSGGAWEFDRLAAVAYLNEHRQRRDAYAALKRRLIADHPGDPAAYADGKRAFVHRTSVLARRWLTEAMLLDV